MIFPSTLQYDLSGHINAFVQLSGELLNTQGGGAFMRAGHGLLCCEEELAPPYCVLEDELGGGRGGGGLGTG